MSECETGQCSVEPKASQAQACNTSECCDIPQQLLSLADDAWHELLKEKIKASLEESCGEKLDELAGLVREANSFRWQHKVQGKVKCDEYQANVRAFFTDCGCEEKQ